VSDGRSRWALGVLGVILGTHLVLLVLSLPDYRVTIDSGYHVALGRWYAEHGTAFWDWINFGPGGRPNLQGPALHVAIAVLGRVLGGSGDDYVLANALLAVAQWAAAMVTAAWFARRIAGDWAALFATALLAGSAVAAGGFAIGIPSGWTFILAPWAIDALLADRTWRCALLTSAAIYFHLGGYATVPLGVAVAAMLTGRWATLWRVGAITVVLTAPYTLHVLRHLEWYRGEHGAVALVLAPLIYIFAAPGLVSALRRPRANALIVAWMASPAIWLVQDYTRFLAQATLPMAVLGGVWLGRLSLPTRFGALRAATVIGILALSVWPTRLNAPSLLVELQWYLGVKYPRILDWRDARDIAAVLERAGLTRRLVSPYNPSHEIRYAAYAPLQFEKGHWVEVQPVRDPAEDLPAGPKVYVLPLPPDDARLTAFRDRGWVTVHGGTGAEAVITLAARPSVAAVTHEALAAIGSEARWLSEHARNNVAKPPGIRLAAWRAMMAEQRQRAGRLQTAVLLLAYGLEPSSPALAKRLRGDARGFGNLANFIGDEECLYFTAEPIHRRLLENVRTLADAADGALRSGRHDVDAVERAMGKTFGDYFTTA
jgi:hypothetical protein